MDYPYAAKFTGITLAGLLSQDAITPAVIQSAFAKIEDEFLKEDICKVLFPALEKRIGADSIKSKCEGLDTATMMGEKAAAFFEKYGM